MDQALLMRVLNRLADLNEEIEPFTIKGNKGPTIFAAAKRRAFSVMRRRPAGFSSKRRRSREGRPNPPARECHAAGASFPEGGARCSPRRPAQDDRHSAQRKARHFLRPVGLHPPVDQQPHRTGAARIAAGRVGHLVQQPRLSAAHQARRRPLRRSRARKSPSAISPSIRRSTSSSSSRTSARRSACAASR